MTAQHKALAYFAAQPDAKRRDLETLHRTIQAIMPGARLWFLDGKDETGKVVTNPNVGYGAYTIKYADGSSREFYQIGISANKSGLSVYVMGLPDKAHLPNTYGATIGKAIVSGYCIKFRALKDVDMDVLTAAIRDGLAATGAG